MSHMCGIVLQCSVELYIRSSSCGARFLKQFTIFDGIIDIFIN